ncbi:MAG: cell division protein ZapA [Acidobacteria bacterium]|nr:cell division protein ZapA [Acidobacteriota bacterium]
MSVAGLAVVSNRGPSHTIGLAASRRAKTENPATPQPHLTGTARAAGCCVKITVVDQDSGVRQQVKVTILNQSFTLLTTGNPREMLDLAHQVDDLMTSISRKSPNLDSTRVAVFACLHLADQLRNQPLTSAVPEERVRELAQLLDEALS